MEYYQGKLCVGFDELTSGTSPLVNPNTLKSWLRRGKAVYARKAHGTGIAALVSFSSLPGEVRTQYIEMYGDPDEICPDPAKARDELSIRMDEDARTFYTHKYTYDKGGVEVRLSEALVEEYTLNASVLNALISRERELKLLRNKLNNSAGSLWAIILDYSEDLKKHYYHTLPSSVARLRKRMKEYKANGYTALISGKIGNANTTKITKEVGDYLVGLKRCRNPRYSNESIFEEYNRIAPSKGWAKIDSITTLRAYLYDPSVKALWLDAVVSEKKAHQKLGYKFHTELPVLPNALWYGDGTRLNLYYLGKDNSGRTALRAVDVYMVMDAATEVFVGWKIGPESSEETQFPAFRDAIIFAGVRPYEIALDNQSGQKKLARRDFFNKISVKGAHFVTPYRAQAKTIEAAFGRFQAQVLSRYPFFTGRNITSRGEEVMPDGEWLHANADLLPQSVQELQELFAQCVEEWHNMIHPNADMSRIDFYRSVANPELQELTLEDKCNLLWIEGSRLHTFTDMGLSLTIKKQTYTYDVYDEEGHIDHLWRQMNINRQYAVKYDPCDLTVIALYEVEKDGSKRFVRFAQPAVVVARAKQDRDERDDALTFSNLRKDKEARMERLAQGRAIDIKAGNAQNYPKVSGLTSEENEWIDARARQLVAADRPKIVVDFDAKLRVSAEAKRAKRLSASYGESMKALSKADPLVEDDNEETIDNNELAMRNIADKW